MPSVKAYNIDRERGLTPDGTSLIYVYAPVAMRQRVGVIGVLLMSCVYKISHSQ